jgi:hypothetical protein
MKCLLDYDYGSALGRNSVHPNSESAIRSALVRGNCPMNSLRLRTESMLDSLELLDRFADPAGANAIHDPWSESTPPLFARHVGDEEEVAEDEKFDDEDDLEDDDFDDEDEDDDFDEEDFDEEDEDDIDEELDDDIEDIDIDEDEDDDFDDDEDLGGLDEDEEEEPDEP